MSSIAGFFHPSFDFTADKACTQQTCNSMLQALICRGPDRQGQLVTPPGVLLHNELCLSQVSGDASRDTLPCEGNGNLRHLSITYDANIYNMPELRARLHAKNVATRHLTDGELFLNLFQLFGASFVQLLRGGFAICILDQFHHRLYLFRDPFGVKPLFFHQAGGTLVFASEIKGIFAYPNVKAQLDLRGLNEIFSMGPARTPGNGIYKDILEVKPGHIVSYTREGFSDVRFHQLDANPHRESYEDTIDHIAFLLKDAIKRQVDLSTPPASFLSGGLDSSLVSALVNEELCENDNHPPLSTFSFDFADSRKYFQANDFQPSLDRPFVLAMADTLHSEHRFLECGSEDQAALLQDAVIAHDMPCMADISSSLLHFCRKTSSHAKVAFTGECADEIFGGYPWYHVEHMRNLNTFPWTGDLHPRRMLLREDFLSRLHMEEYISEAYTHTVQQVSYLPNDSADNRTHRRLFILTVTWFMQTLLDRMDRAAASSGISACVPFVDIPLVEYLYNVPWEMKAKNGEVKHLLREVAKPYLPDTILHRKKSPYPKNYHPHYEQILVSQCKSLIASGDSPLLDYVDVGKLLEFCDSHKDYGKPWFGQLMAGPQLLAYYLQIDFWLKHYEVKIVS